MNVPASHYEQIVKCARDSVFLLAETGAVLEANDAACALYGYSSDEFSSLNAGDVQVGENRSHFLERWNAAAEPGGLLFETIHRRKDGTTFPVEVSVRTIWLDEQHLRIAFVRDISERRRTESQIQLLHDHLLEHNAVLEQRVADRTVELEIARARAEAADSAKSQFLNTMSHELRTPLNAIIGFTEILLDRSSGALNAEQERQLGIVRDASQQLLVLINDVLDIARIEAGEMRLSCTKVEVVALLKRVAAAFSPRAERLGLQLRVDVEHVPALVHVYGDARRIEQVVNNLLSNALKFTPQGSVVLRLEERGKDVEVAVSDTGIGIHAEDYQKLFRPFSQIHKARSPSQEGSGLGLAITRHMVEAMGGSIHVESVWGQGSRFTFLLPAAQSS